MTLFEKLSLIRAEPVAENVVETVAENMAENVAENVAETVAEPVLGMILLTAEEIKADVLKKLALIGDTREVVPATPLVAAPAPVVDYSPPIGKFSEAAAPTSSDAPTESALKADAYPLQTRVERSEQVAAKADKTERTSSKLGGPCPTCGVVFTHLRRHRCKVTLAEDLASVHAAVFETVPTAPTPTSTPTSAPVPASSPPSVVHIPATPIGKFSIATAPAKAKEKNATASPSSDTSTDSALETGGYILVLNAVVVSRAVHPFCDFVTPIATAVAEKAHVAHWGLIEFGKGPATLCAAVAEVLKSDPPRGFLAATTEEAETRACLGVLQHYAQVVIRGV